MKKSILRRVIICVLSLATLVSNASASALTIASSASIPERMMPNCIVTYGDKLEMSIEADSTTNRLPSNRLTAMAVQDEVPDHKGRAAEDALFAQVKEEAKNLPHIRIKTNLPKPVPGMKVIYGSDGGINHIYYPENAKTVYARSSHVGYNKRKAAGTYTFGDHDNTITITSNSVTGEGRFTVFRAGVGGSNAQGMGSSGKILETGDVATNWNYDNPRHNTAIDARALDTDIKKTVYKNDIGELPDAVLDIYFWGWEYKYFGYMYSDTLSFPGRYYYSF